jgi:hypothetical protein
MSSDIQRKVTFISLSWHRPPLSAQRANLNWWPTLGRMLFGFSKIKGECKAFRNWGSCSLDARVETANADISFHHAQSKSLILALTFCINNVAEN